MYICVCVCLSACVYLCVSVCVCLCLGVCVSACVCGCVYLCLSACVHVCLSVFVYLFVSLCFCVGLSACVSVCVCCVYLLVCIFVYVCVSVFICLCVSVCVCCTEAKLGAGLVGPLSLSSPAAVDGRVHQVFYRFLMRNVQTFVLCGGSVNLHRNKRSAAGLRVTHLSTDLRLFLGSLVTSTGVKWASKHHLKGFPYILYLCEFNEAAVGFHVFIFSTDVGHEVT